MKNGLLIPSINAICKAGGDAMHKAYKRPSAERSVSRREMRFVLKKIGITGSQAEQMLKAMGYPEPARRGK